MIEDEEPHQTDREFADSVLKRTGGKELCIVLGIDSATIVSDAIAERFRLKLGSQVIGGTDDDDDYLIYTTGRVRASVIHDARLYAEGVVKGMHSERRDLAAWLSERTDTRLDKQKGE